MPKEEEYKGGKVYVEAVNIMKPVKKGLNLMKP
jgi:hypothetical protein